MDDKLKGKDAQNDTSRNSLVPQPGIGFEGGISTLPTAGMLVQPRYPAFQPIPTIWVPPSDSKGNDAPEVESGSDLDEGDDSADASDSPTTFRSVSVASGINIFARGVAEALNSGHITAVKHVIASTGSTVLNLAEPGVPMLQRKGLETLGELLSDPSVVLRELALGKVTHGITKVIEGLEKSRHLMVLDVCSFDGGEGETPDGYTVSAVFLYLSEAFAKHSLTLQQLVVSEKTLLREERSRNALASLQKAAGHRLKVQRK
jgi:hypothetical protein